MNKIKSILQSIGKWFASWFVSVDGKPNRFVRIGKWFKTGEDLDGNKLPSGFSLFMKKDGVVSIISSLICILVGLIVGFIVILCVNAEHSLKAIGTVLAGGFNHPTTLKGIATVLTDTAPLLLCGLSVVFAYKCGLFNIGVAGQNVAGILFVYVGALALHLPWYLCLLFAMVGGAIWGALPGALKAYFGINEVISGIMLNWVILYVTNAILGGSTFYNINQSSCYDFRAHASSALLPTLGLDKLFANYRYIGIGFIIAILVAVVVWIILNKTKMGFEIRATGANKDSAKYAGMDEKRNIILTMAISGALAGLAAGSFYLTGIEQYNPNFGSALPAVGFNGIAVGFLGAISPIGTIFASLFVTHITIGGTYLDNTYYSKEVADIISSVIIYVCAFSAVIKALYLKIGKNKKSSTKQPAKEGGNA